MNKSYRSKEIIVYCVLAVSLILLVAVVYFAGTVSGREKFNAWQSRLKETDVNTAYEEQKRIEDNLRAYMASYEADRITYITNKDGETKQESELAIAAKTRANRTAATYNEYFLKNKHVWADNIPEDIVEKLEYIE